MLCPSRTVVTSLHLLLFSCLKHVHKVTKPNSSMKTKDTQDSEEDTPSEGWMSGLSDNSEKLLVVLYILKSGAVVTVGSSLFSSQAPRHLGR